MRLFRGAFRIMGVCRRPSGSRPPPDDRSAYQDTLSEERAMVPSVGRIVHYRLSDADITRIGVQRAKPGFGGNQPRQGDVVPLLIVRVWDNEFQHCGERGVSFDGTTWHPVKSHYGVNGQAILDGNDSLWVCSAPQGDGPGMWDWPPRAASIELQATA